MNHREHNYSWLYSVSIHNLDNELVYIEDAQMDLLGLVEILTRFLDVSNEGYREFMDHVHHIECDSYLMQGAKGTDDPWVVVVKKKSDLLLEHQGFWKKLLKGKTW